MTESLERLTFLATPWSLTASIIVVLLGAVLSYYAWYRSGYRASIGLLELVRVLVITLIAVIFNQPEWVEEFRPREKPTVAILWDDSASMSTADVTGGGSATRPISRRDSIRPIQRRDTWQSLEQQLAIQLQAFGTEDPQHGSDLHAALTQVLEQTSNLRGVVLVSDGDWNTGPAPVQAAMQYRLREIPVFTVPVGSRTRLPDVELLSLDAPTFGVAGKAVRIPFTIDSALAREFTTTVTLRSSDGDQVTKEVSVAAMGRTNDWILWKPAAVGDYTLTLDVPRHPDELLANNNQLTAPIAIREEKLKVLVVESYPRWEYRYLRNALSRDPGVEVACLLFHPDLGKVGGGNKDYIKQFPAGLDELSTYDVVFLGDVGLDDNQLTSEQCRLLKGLVERQASGLVFMPGWQGRQFSLIDTPLEELYPVLLDPTQPGGWGSRRPGQFELTESGRRSLLTRLADTQDENAQVWEDLPGFQWYAPVLRAKAGGEVLAVHQDMSNQYGRLPLLVTRTYGAGKVLFMGTDGAWRWRKGVEDKYHYRFWGQVVRWMAYQRNMAKGESMRLYYAPDQPQVRQTLALSANVMDARGEPLPTGTVVAKITSPAGRTETIRLTSTGDEWGQFHGSFTAREPGKHEVILACQETASTLETSFFVQGGAREQVGRPARPEVLEELARVTRGRVLHPDRLDQMVQSLAAIPEPPPAVRRIQLWSHPLLGGLVVVLLGVFWIGRKAVGLI